MSFSSPSPVAAKYTKGYLPRDSQYISGLQTAAKYEKLKLFQAQKKKVSFSSNNSETKFSPISLVCQILILTQRMSPSLKTQVWRKRAEHFREGRNMRGTQNLEVMLAQHS